MPDETATLEAKKAVAKAKLKLNRDQAEWAGVETPLGRVDSDPNSQRKISGAVTLAMLGGQNFTIDWRMADNTTVTHDHDATVATGLAVGQHVAACQAHKNSVEAEIDAATTEEELEAISLLGFPGD